MRFFTSEHAKTHENRKDEQVLYKFIVGVLHRRIHEHLYLLLGKVTSIDTFGRILEVVNECEVEFL